MKTSKWTAGSDTSFADNSLKVTDTKIKTSQTPKWLATKPPELATVYINVAEQEIRCYCETCRFINLHSKNLAFILYCEQLN
jgi:hypothetical protein